MPVIASPPVGPGRPARSDHRALRRWPAGALLVAATLLAACSGGGADDGAAAPDADASTTRPTTDATGATTTVADEPAAPDEPAMGTPIEVGRGLVTFRLPETWDPDDLLDGLPRPALDRELAREWALDDETVRQLAYLTSDDLIVILGMEPRYLTADEDTWRAALLAELEARESAVIEDTTDHTWAGADGERSTGTLPDNGWFQVDTVHAGSQFVSVLTLATGEPDGDARAELDAFLASIEVDDSVLPPLQHALDARGSVTFDAADGGDDFEVSLLAPLAWELDDGTERSLYEDPEGDGFLTVDLNDPGPSYATETYLAELTADPFFAQEIVRDERTIDDLVTTTLYEGDPEVAEAAIVTAEEGRLIVTVRLYTPGEPELLAEMLASLRYLRS